MKTSKYLTSVTLEVESCTIITSVSASQIRPSFVMVWRSEVKKLSSRIEKDK